MAMKNVYFFGAGKTEGDASMRDTLGGKGANLAEMTNLGIPVPPGFTITTDVCAAYYNNGKKLPPGLEKDVLAILTRLEKTMGKKLGDPSDPLLVSIRSGAAASMPGMMDTVLNLGMTDRSVRGLIAQTRNPRFAWDAYRRFIQMYCNVVMEVSHDAFEESLEKMKHARGVKQDNELTAGDLERLVDQYKLIVKKETGKDFPQNPLDQLWGSVRAVFDSWNNDRAIKYRQLNNIRGLKGTAVNVQSMVFGNYGDDSGTGVCFSRDPSTGENAFYGEFLMNAQGEDVVAGIRTPDKIEGLAKKQKKSFDELVRYKNRLEKHFRDMQDIEFTIQQGRLYILQTRNGKRTGAAAIKIALDMVAEKLITKEQAVARVSPELLDQLLHPMIDANARKSARVLAKGLNASPGAACGKIVFTADEAEEWHARGEKVMLVRRETSPEDIGGMHVAQGIITSTGGMTSHAAVVARGMGTPCIAGATAVIIQGKNMTIGSKSYREGDFITIDGSTGEIFDGQVPLVAPKISKDMVTFLKWCDEITTKSKRGTQKGFEVWANAEAPEDAKRAFDFGAQGIGLCRTEHMFFDREKIPHFRAMIVANSLADRKAALQKILPLQQKDFFGIFKSMEGKPVVIRLLDPPLHEFLPQTPELVKELADQIRLSPAALQAKIDSLHEMNPMLGHRGCRLALTYPEIYDMQVEAIALAAVECVKQKIPVKPEIMIPLIITPNELEFLRGNAEKVLKKVFDAAKIRVPIKIGTMIEVPRAAIQSRSIAPHADFYSFGTNDLTQMTLGISRDDGANFLPHYVEQTVLADDPFKTIDEGAVGYLIDHAVREGRSVKPDLKIGICGEHGGDPATIDFCYRAGLSYVSCSPFRVPLARLAAAQAVLANGKKSSSSSAAADKPAARGRKPAARGRKPAAKKPAKKAAAKKPGRKPAAKKPAGRKVADKRTAIKKTAAKKPGRKPAAKKAPGRKPAAKKATVKKAADRKATVRKAAVKKTPGRKPAVKKAAVKKAAVKKATVKKAAVKKPVARKAADKKPVVRKAAVKKAAVKKAPAKKAAAKKPAARKAAPRRAK
ncbi:MAG: pyruvate, phosphate dikinase [Treponema sp.]|nr:pyruvate, phosphate dikinase [Treponema sp.]